jgi:hypothetical protein
LNTSELVNGKVYIPASGRVLAIEDYNTDGAEGAQILLNDVNTVDGALLLTNTWVLMNNPYTAYFSIEMTLSSANSETQSEFEYVQPDLKSFDDRIKALEALINS